MRTAGLLLVALLVIGAAVGGWLAWSWYGQSYVEEDTVFVVPEGASLTAVAEKLDEEGLIDGAKRFRVRVRIFGGGEPVKAGEYRLPAGASPSTIHAMLQSGDIVRRYITIPEGMPSVLVHEKLLAEDRLTGDIEVPPEGSILPETYDFRLGESRQAVIGRMQAAMDRALAEAWADRGPDLAVSTPEEAVILASIVEKETGTPGERRTVAGLYSNRLKQGIMLQADPTIIYPITQGRPLGRRIRQSEIAAVNEYNTYAMTGLPSGPITNPGRASIEAVLHPAQTSALYMVADGTGGHAFADTLAEHNANVEKWYALRRERGEM